MSERKLAAWLNAGVIDAETAARIKAFEDTQSRPWGLWALIGMGALTIGLGLISLIAANWAAIPGETRLAIHAAIILLYGAWLWLRGLKGDDDETAARFSDAKLFVFVFLGLTLLGHIGQVYQTSAPLWQPLALIMLIFSPLLILFGRTAMTGLLWLTGVIVLCGLHGVWFVDRIDRSPSLYLGALAAVPAMVVALAAIAPGRFGHAGFWRAVEQSGLQVIAYGASLLVLVLGFDSASEKFSNLLVVVGLSGLSAAAVWVMQPSRDGRAVASIIALCAGVTLLAGFSGGYSAVPNATLFLILWAGIGWVALSVGWRRIFQMAVSIAALRLIILSFELGGDLLGSGIGLIFTGLITIGIAWGAFRISKTYAPTAQQGGAA